MSDSGHPFPEKTPGPSGAPEPSGESEPSGTPEAADSTPPGRRPEAAGTAPVGKTFFRQRMLPCLEALLYPLIYLAVRYGFVLITELVLIVRMSPLADSPSELLAMVTTVFAEHSQVYAMMISCLVLLLLSVLFRNNKTDLATETALGPLPLRAGALSLAAGVSANLVLSSALALLPIPESLADSHSDTITSLSTGFFPLVLLNLIVLAPLVEETVLRGLFQSRLRRVLPAFAGCLLSAAAFSLLHSDPLQMIYAFPAGLLFGWLYEKSGSLLAPFLVHAAFNGTSVLLLMLPPLTSPLLWLLFGGGAAVLSAVLVSLFRRSAPSENHP